MTLLTQKFSTLALFLVVFGGSTALAQTNDEQVSFTATGTAVLTALTKLPGGLTQLDFSVSGKATHLGDFTGQGTRIQNHQGNFGTTSVFVGANGKDSVFISISGQFETSKDKCLWMEARFLQNRSGNSKCLPTRCWRPIAARRKFCFPQACSSVWAITARFGWFRRVWPILGSK